MGDTPHLNSDDQAMVDSLEEALKELSTGVRKSVKVGDKTKWVKRDAVAQEALHASVRPEINASDVEEALSIEDPLISAVLLRELLPKPQTRVHMGVEVDDITYAAALIALVGTLRMVMRTGGDLPFCVDTIRRLRFNGMLWDLDEEST